MPLFGDDVAPRFDLATEVIITSGDDSNSDRDQQIIVLPQPSAEQLCHLILTEGIETVICGGIEEEYFRYLVWKKVKVLDSVIGTWKAALNQYFRQGLQPGEILSTLTKKQK